MDYVIQYAKKPVLLRLVEWQLKLKEVYEQVQER